MMFFFAHWSSTSTAEVARSQPIPIGTCPFCKYDNADAIIKIYNTKTKHYSSFSLGRGDFHATFTCRNCTTEGQLRPEVERMYVDTHLTGIKFDEIVKRHQNKPDKAIRDLEKMISKNPHVLIIDELKEKLSEWKQRLPQPNQDGGT